MSITRVTEIVQPKRITHPDATQQGHWNPYKVVLLSSMYPLAKLGPLVFASFTQTLAQFSFATAAVLVGSSTCAICISGLVAAALSQIALRVNEGGL